MEEISRVTLGLNNPLCVNPAITNHMEITLLKLETETASLLSDSAIIINEMVEDKRKPDIIIQNVQENEEDKILLVVEEPTLLTSVELLPLYATSNLSVPLDTLETSLSIAVEIEGPENGQILAKVVSLADRNVKRRLSEDIVTVAEKQNEECSSGPMIEASVVAVKLSSETVSNKGGVKSVFELDCLPLWGSVSICGHRAEMEDDVMAVANFMKIPIKMFVGDNGIAGISQTLSHLTSHFFGVYDGHGGSQVANYCRDRMHFALAEELENVKDVVNGTIGNTRQVQWENVFTSCFLKVDNEVGGKVARVDPKGYINTDLSPSVPVTPETVGSTAVVAIVCSAHIIVANCGDSRAVLCRGKEAIPLSIDHKPSREDEYARIEACGGKWQGHTVEWTPRFWCSCNVKVHW